VAIADFVDIDVNLLKERSASILLQEEVLSVIATGGIKGHLQMYGDQQSYSRIQQLNYTDYRSGPPKVIT